MIPSKNLLLFAGTTEGRRLSECLAAAGICHTICVATEYGEIVLKPHPLVKIHQGRMNQEQIAAFIAKESKEAEGFAAVIDATHPFAQDVTRNIKAALAESDIPYFRLKRNRITRNCGIQQEAETNLIYFDTNESCAKALEQTEGNILLTTGSKELSKYCVSEQIKQRLYVRILPSVESLSLCMEQGVRGKQILAMQGPFTAEMNEAILQQYHISYLVTKESGVSGGYLEKLAAAKRAGAHVFVIHCPEEEEGSSFEEVCDKLEKISGRKIGNREIKNREMDVSQMINHEITMNTHEMSNQKIRGKKLEIILAGIGMGHADSMTAEVQAAVSCADILLGAERMLENVPRKTLAEKHSFYRAEQIIPYLRTVQENVQNQASKKVVILFSGDSGFYSGCQLLYTALMTEVQEKRLDASIHILPGISSVAYLASCVGESYHDAAIYSIHGKKLCNLVQRVQNSAKTFLLTSGVRDVNWLGKQLVSAGMSECEVVVGYQLSYVDQQIRKCTPAECCGFDKEGLYTCLVKNPYPVAKRLTHGISDESFVRDQRKIPMTKEEVREVSICKLRLRDGAVVYDIGSGTGSVAVEIAVLSNDIQVYAVEQKQEAVSLIEANKARFGLQNLSVIEAAAPEGLSGLPAATHAFIGGSGGRLKEILSTLQQMNPDMRIVVNAVSMETICEMKEILSTFFIKNEEIVQLQANRIRQIGNYHLMHSQNPVWICAFEFAGRDTL